MPNPPTPAQSMPDRLEPDRLESTTLPIATGAQVRAVVAALLRQHLGRTLAVSALFLVAAALGLVMPASLGRIIDAVSTNAGFATIAFWVGGVAVGAIAAAGASLWGLRLLTSLVQDALASLREDVFASAMRLPVSTVDDGESADLLSRVTGDVDAVAEAGGNVMPILLSAIFTIVVSLAALTALDPWLALAGVACVPFYLLGTRAFLRRSRVVFREVREREADRGQAVIEAVEGRETLLALNEQAYALDRVRRRAEASIVVQIEGVRLRNRLFRWINGGELVGLAAILTAGFVLHSTDVVTVGMVTTAALVFHRLFDPIGQLIFGLDDVQRAAIGLARLVGVINLAAMVTEPLTAAQPSAERLPSPRRSAERRAATGIELQNVSFRYPTTGRGVSTVSLRVEPGTTVAFVGSSGSGKSTLARLIAGHHLPDSGSLRLYPATVTPYYISQELHQFRGSIADNLRLVAPDASTEQLAAAVIAVGADWALPALAADSQSASNVVKSGSTRDTVRSEFAGSRAQDGSDWSLDEGRIQQLAIARALLADPELVILDEATADVGLQHRAAVETALDALCRDRTAIVIAHRLHQAAHADQIVVFEAGSLRERGSHAQLIAAAGLYEGFWRAQVGADSIPPVEKESS
jgi:ABC-type multidrug transport system fused ATPase/permease subunit